MEGRGAIFRTPTLRVALVSRFPLCQLGSGVAVEFVLHPGESTTFILRQIEDNPDRGLLEARLVGEQLLADTMTYWRRWLSQCRYRGRWREMVNRSALTLVRCSKPRVPSRVPPGRQSRGPASLMSTRQSPPPERPFATPTGAGSAHRRAAPCCGAWAI